MTPGAWAYRVLHKQFGLVVGGVDGDGGFEVRLYDRQGLAVDTEAVQVPRAQRHEWCRVRKPVFPVAPACHDVDDWLVRDFDFGYFGMSPAEVDDLFKQPRMVDLDEFVAFYESKGFVGGVSVALRELGEALERDHCRDSSRRQALALPLPEYLSFVVRPRGCANRLSLAEYPLSEAMEDWAQQHDHALEQVCAQTQTNVERHRG
ncbi:MAG TPA: hypothetical protein VN259_06990 [Xanthomonadales bacterium]|nr:hypothetical protein [Xanthomonadales bacterium]